MKVYDLGLFTSAPQTGATIEVDIGSVTPQKLKPKAVFQNIGLGGSIGIMRLDGSVDGTNFMTITTLSANTASQVIVMPYMRAVCVAFAFGTTQCYLAR